MLSSPVPLSATFPSYTPNPANLVTLTTDKDVYIEETDENITVTATLPTAREADLNVNIRVEGGGVGRFLTMSGDNAHNRVITITAGATSGTATYRIQTDNIVEDDTETNGVEVNLRAPDADGDYPVTNDKAPTITVRNDDKLPGAPNIVRVIPGPAKIDVIWDEPEDIGGGGIAGNARTETAITSYRICIHSDLDTLRGNTCNVGHATWTTSLDLTTDKMDTQYRASVGADSLSADVQYYVGIAARNGATAAGAIGVGEFAVYEENGAPQALAPLTVSKPNPPTGVSAALLPGGKIRATWTKPTGGTTPDGYWVCAIAGNASDGVTHADTSRCGLTQEDLRTVFVAGVDTNTYTFDGSAGTPTLEIDKFYAVHVRSRRNVSTPPGSDWVRATTSTTDNSLQITIEPPTEVTAVAGDGEIDVHWTASASADSYTVLRRRARRRRHGDTDRYPPQQ